MQGFRIETLLPGFLFGPVLMCLIRQHPVFVRGVVKLWNAEERTAEQEEAGVICEHTPISEIGGGTISITFATYGLGDRIF